MHRDCGAHDEFGADYEKLENGGQGRMTGRLADFMRTDTYAPETRSITIDPLRAAAFQANLAHYSDVFSQGRTDYAIPAGAIHDAKVAGDKPLKVLGIYVVDKTKPLATPAK